ncbi:epsin-2 isoform X3 [Neocloeon triangulifer]|uniref:epsin-2 isoform X3 n=1 Tax=Neocloeon triangulifer TaxID=2078957 RepID=UPI00286EE537|nr:epsin-2 isoform X3 [Neocloeon triangulifer]
MASKKAADIQVNVAGIRRTVKNLAHNYSDAQVKVREATSNDPWGPSSTIMSEIADLTYNVVAFTEIMQMIWKRLNDHGKNWRHVYKALVLLEYLIKTGSEKVAMQCKENIFAIQTLRDFQYVEDFRDQGLNVREKAKQLVSLLKDDEKLKNERVRALKAKERFAQAQNSFSSDVEFLESPSGHSPAQGAEDKGRSRMHSSVSSELENARPQTIGEEELQLQLALAMSREEADQEEQKKRSDDVRLQLAISQSQEECKGDEASNANAWPTSPSSNTHQSHMLDLLDISPEPTADTFDLTFDTAKRPSQKSDPWSVTSPPLPLNDPWNTSVLADGWQTSNPAASNANPWSPSTSNQLLSNNDTSFDFLKNNNAADPFQVQNLVDTLPSSPTGNASSAKLPQSFLGENFALVNLDNLVPAKQSNQAAPVNPFAAASPATQPKPSLNQMIQQTGGQPNDPWAPVNNSFPKPAPSNNVPNPFFT